MSRKNDILFSCFINNNIWNLKLLNYRDFCISLYSLSCVPSYYLFCLSPLPNSIYLMLTTLLCSRSRFRPVGLCHVRLQSGSDWPQMEKNPGLFRIIFQYILARSRAKMYWNWSWKIPDLYHLGLIWPNLRLTLTALNHYTYV